MTHVARILCLPLACALAACGDDGTAPPADEFAGVWLATEIELVSAANPTVSIDLVDVGAAGTLTLTAAHGFTLLFTVPEDEGMDAAGTWSASSDVLTLTFTAGSSGNWQFDYTLNGDLLVLNGAHTEFDFNDDGIDDDARLNLSLARQ